VLSTWAKILDRVPGSVLWIKNGALGYQQARTAFAQDLAEAGIDVARVRMEGWEASGAILELYSRMHIALDPFPFCGGLTSFDALWMGVPVVTLEQPLMAARQTLAMLRNMKHDELVAADTGEYSELAVALAKDVARLSQYRHDLRKAFTDSALARPEQLASNLEAAYAAMAAVR
jgi:protein O-GlcNAc transferase